jgi:hypothetical protein
MGGYKANFFPKFFFLIFIFLTVPTVPGSNSRKKTLQIVTGDSYSLRGPGAAAPVGVRGRSPVGRGVEGVSPSEKKKKKKKTKKGGLRGSQLTPTLLDSNS